MNNLKRGLAVAAAVALPFSLAALPANAAGAAQIAGTEDNTYIVQEKVVTDAGGQDFKITVRWDETYRTASGNIRVTVPYVKINAIGVDEDRDSAGDGGVDATVQSFNGYADGHVKLIQTISLNGANDPVQVNPANPLNRPNVSKIRVYRVGVDDDGYGGSAPVDFIQPVVGDEDPGADGPGTEAA